MYVCYTPSFLESQKVGVMSDQLQIPAPLIHLYLEDDHLHLSPTCRAAHSLSLTLESFCPHFSIHKGSRVLMGTQALVNDCLHRPGEAWLKDLV